MFGQIEIKFDLNKNLDSQNQKRKKNLYKHILWESKENYIETLTGFLEILGYEVGALAIPSPDLPIAVFEIKTCGFRLPDNVSLLPLLPTAR